jgi:DNA-binding NarL/FixJ family response regulator
MIVDEAIKFALSKEEPPSSTQEQVSADEPLVALTPREQEVAILVAKRLSNRQIASHLTLSEHTVATHTRNILKKLGLHSRTQIAVYFTEQP